MTDEVYRMKPNTKPLTCQFSHLLFLFQNFEEQNYYSEIITLFNTEAERALPLSILRAHLHTLALAHSQAHKLKQSRAQTH